MNILVKWLYLRIVYICGTIVMMSIFSNHYPVDLYRKKWWHTIDVNGHFSSSSFVATNQIVSHFFSRQIGYNHLESLDLCSRSRFCTFDRMILFELGHLNACLVSFFFCGYSTNGTKRKGSYDYLHKVLDTQDIQMVVNRYSDSSVMLNTFEPRPELTHFRFNTNE